MASFMTLTMMDAQWGQVKGRGTVDKVLNSCYSESVITLLTWISGNIVLMVIVGVLWLGLIAVVRLCLGRAI